MINFLLQRILACLARIVGAGVVVILMIELAYCVFGASDQHVWKSESYHSDKGMVRTTGESWYEIVRQSTANSARVWLLAYGGALLIGYSWGILSARWRRFRVSALLALPFSLLACVPGVWFVVVVAIYSYFAWQRPGFADELVIETGPDLVGWWNAAVVAIPVLAPAAAWQIRGVCAAIEDEAGKPFVKGLFVSGRRDEDIFYRNILRRARGNVVALLDQCLPFVLGAAIAVEWAFRYEGLGRLFVDSVKEGHYVGIISCCLVVASVIGFTTMVKEVAVKFVGDE